MLGKAGADLGGMTIDQWLFEEVLERCGRRDGDEDVRALSNALMVECEHLKEQLSFHQRGDVTLVDPDTGTALDEIGIDDLAILFDDTRGDVPDLAAREAEIVHAALDVTRASRVVMCPTYYSDDRMLDVVFGQRPAGYLDDLGRRLDPSVGVYWTGEEICTREFSAGHLTRVAESLRRKPTLWDN